MFISVPDLGVLVRLQIKSMSVCNVHEIHVHSTVHVYSLITSYSRSTKGRRKDNPDRYTCTWYRPDKQDVSHRQDIHVCMYMDAQPGELVWWDKGYVHVMFVWQSMTGDLRNFEDF